MEWTDNPTEMVAALRNAAVDAIFGHPGLVGDTLYWKASEEIERLKAERDELLQLTSVIRADKLAHALRWIAHHVTDYPGRVIAAREVAICALNGDPFPDWVKRFDPVPPLPSPERPSE